MASEQTALPLEYREKIGEDLRRRITNRRFSILVLTLALLTLAVLAAGIGPVKISPNKVVSILMAKVGVSLGIPFEPQHDTVITAIRLPRVVLAIIAGAALGIAGAALQGLFRNPLADPGLVGVSAGAAAGAISIIVLGNTVLAPVTMLFGAHALPLCAFVGGMGVTFLIFRVSTSNGRTNIGTMLLAGIAINSLIGALIGLLTYISTDEQLRSLTFWSMGSLGAANWKTLSIALPFTLLAMFLLIRQSRVLNAISLGETPAAHLGFNVQRSRRLIIIFSSLAVGSIVSMVGAIGFIGLVVPHLVRLLLGPDHRGVLPASALLGAILLLGADLLGRNVVAPTEVPVGIITAACGAPFFLWLLLKDRRLNV